MNAAEVPSPDPADVDARWPEWYREAAYVPDLEAAGYVLRVREADWCEHRLFKGPHVDVNLHTFSANCPELDRMIRFRDWLRATEADRDLYARAKRKLAAHDWRYMQQYADAETAVILEIMGRAQDRQNPPRAPQIASNRLDR